MLLVYLTSYICNNKNKIGLINAECIQLKVRLLHLLFIVINLKICMNTFYLSNFTILLNTGPYSCLYLFAPPPSYGYAQPPPPGHTQPPPHGYTHPPPPKSPRLQASRHPSCQEHTHLVKSAVDVLHIKVQKPARVIATSRYPQKFCVLCSTLCFASNSYMSTSIILRFHIHRC